MNRFIEITLDKEFPYLDPGEDCDPNNMQHIKYTAYGSYFPKNRIYGIESQPPQYIPHYCNITNDNVVGIAEITYFKEMVE